MQLSAEAIATIVSGVVEGNIEVKVNKLSKIEEGEEGSICFLSNSKYLSHIYTTNASIVLIDKSFELTKDTKATLIRVADPYAAFTLLLQEYEKLSKAQIVKRIEEHSYVSPKAVIEEDVYIGAFSYVSDHAHIGKNSLIYPQVFIGKNVKIGKNTILMPGVKIYDDCIVGENCILHAGTVIGSDGFGFALQADGVYQKIPQIGNVILEDNIEMGANCAIDRATMGATMFKKGVKLDNLVHIAHNVEVDENTVIAGQTGIAGSTRIGKNCQMGGQVGIAGHLQIADFTGINAQSGVSKSVIKPNTQLNDSPAFEYKSALKSQVIYRNLPIIEQRIIELEKLVEKLSLETLKNK